MIDRFLSLQLAGVASFHSRALLLRDVLSQMFGGTTLSVRRREGLGICSLRIILYEV